MMELVELLRGLDVVHVAGPAPEAARGPIRGLAHDSRRVAAGDLFAAWTGMKTHGRDHAPQAIERGALAVLCDEPPAAERASGLDVPWVTTREPRRLLATLGARLYRRPDRELEMVGVTGTNGKTTVVALVTSILEAAGKPTGTLGTLGYRFRDRDLGFDRTTPEASDLFRILRLLRDEGAVAVAMEVSSHALEQGRVEGVEFAVAAFTNLTRDHFDFHGDLEHYFLAKRRLFAQLANGGVACLNVDDHHGRRLAEEFAAGPNRVLTFGEGGSVSARRVVLDEDGIRGTLRTPRGEFDFMSPLRGRYNLENLLASVTVGEALDVPIEAIVRGLRERGPLAGRLEPVAAGQEFPALVDYAHTDAALEAALGSVREFSRRKLIVVFGCGGDRDPGKRPLMGEIAGRLADLPIATTDNPRTEDPRRILDAVEEGLRASGNSAFEVEIDRRRAIRRAVDVALAAPGEWILVVAGKGHEAAQLVGSERLPFSDPEEIASAIRRATARGTV
jgi:UDP-N-acetylmuramoyl-L-alanyl-D-glutamate--2,6-diaminopimelate ligase